MYDKTDYALVARNPLTAGFLDRACQLMGALFLTALMDATRRLRIRLTPAC